MSGDEAIVTIGATVVGPTMWAFWLFRNARLARLRQRRAGVVALALTLAACTALIVGVLKTAASFDVVDSPEYLFMYVVLGLAWLRVVGTVLRVRSG